MFSFLRRVSASVPKQASESHRMRETLEDRWLYSGSPIPAAIIDLPPESMINESFQFAVEFDNASTTASDVGYAPYVDLSVPDGIDLTGASYLGSPVNLVEVGVFDAGGNLVDAGGSAVLHPMTGLAVTGTPGELLYVLEMPFGSFVPDQPNATIDIDAVLNTADGAMVGTAMDISATAGFALGCTPLDDPGTDPPIMGTTNTAAITPTVINLIKSSNAAETETATGPNFPVKYSLTIDIANGETITNLDIRDVLPNSFVYSGGVSVMVGAGVSVAGQNVTDEPVTGAPQNAPNNDFLIEFTSVTGTLAEDDLVLMYTIYVDEFDADGNPVIDPASGDDVMLNNDAMVSGDHSSGPVSDDDMDTDFVLEARSLAVQKGYTIQTDVGGAGPTPGDVIEYTIDVQVSDFFSFSNLVLDDNFSDGQLFDATFVPTFSIAENGVTTSGAFAAANYTVTQNSPGDGSTDVFFDISAEDLDGIVNGDLFADSTVTSGTTVTVVFRTVIQESFTDTFPSGDSSVDIGDVLTNDVTVSGLLPSGQSEDDTSGTSFAVQGPSIAKEVYAIDGNLLLADDDLVAGHTITYRITMDLASVDVENLVLTDFLPLPIYTANELTTYDAGGPTATPPPAGSWTYGPSHDLNTVVPATDPPTLLIDNVANTAAWDFGTFDSAPSASATIDLLFTVSAQDVLMADGLFLTNQVLATYGTTNSGETSNAAIAPTVVAAPALDLTKGIVSTDAASGTFSPSTVGPVPFAAPGLATAAFAGGVNSTNLAASPIDSDLNGIDAGDLVKFAVVIENTGGADGFNVNITDLLPAGFQIPTGGPGLNLQVLDGDGNGLAYSGVPADLFSTGIEVTDPSVFTGGINSFDNAQLAGDGSNIIVITYDLEATIDVEPGETITNTALIDEFGAVDGGNDHTAGSNSSEWTDDASVTTTDLVPVKSLVSTSESHTGVVSGRERLTIGEIVRYRLVVEIPEGTLTNFQLQDRLPGGLQFINDDTTTVAFVGNNVGVSSNDTSGTLNLGLAAAPFVAGNESTVAGITPAFVLGDVNIGSSSSTSSNLDAYGSGTDVYFKLGDVINADDDADQEFVVLEFNALVLNDPGSNDHGDTRTNNFDTRFTSDAGVVTDRSNDVTIGVVEPRIDNVVKMASPSGGDAGDVITFSITFSNATGSTIADAFDVVVTDALSANYVLNVPSVSVTLGGGAVGVTNASAGNSVDITIDQIPSGGTVTINYSATLVNTVAPGDDIVNTVDVNYTSLPGAGTVANPTGSTTPGASGGGDGERNGDGAHNDYSDSAMANVTIDAPTVAKSLISTSIVNANNANNEAVIGETAQYRLTVTVPEGVTSLAEIVDTLDVGLSFVSLDSIAASPALSSDTIDLNDSTSITPMIGGQMVTFELGTITNANVDNAAAETIVLTYTVLVDNVSTNQGEGVGTMLDNSALIQWEVGGTTATSLPDDAEDIEVIEPDLDVAKSVAPGTADAGDPVVYTITVSHNGASDTDAYDVVFNDSVPAAINVVSFSVAHSSAGDISSDFGLIGNTLATNPAASFDLLIGETVTITINGTVASTVNPGDTLSNTASVGWSSLDGVDAGERDDAGGIDNYTDSGSADLLVTAPAIVKSLLGTSIVNANNANNEAVIGETIQYQVQVTVPEGELNSVMLIDNLDVGLQFVSLDNVVVQSGGAATADVTTNLGVGDFSDIATFAPTVLGQQLTFDLGDLANSNVDNGAAETITLTYTVLVLDLATNQTETDTMLDNSAQLQWMVGGATAMSPVVDAEDVEIIEPELSIVKSVSDTTPHLGDVVTFTITIDHSVASDTDAFDIGFSDSLPLGMTLDLATLSVSGATVVTDTSAGNNINLELDELLLGAGPVTITYNAQISTNPAVLDLGMNNTGTISWTSLDGVDANERDGSGGVDDYVASDGETTTPIGADLAITKDDGLTEVTAGETYVYQIVVTNSGSDVATGVTVSDTIPLNVLQFVSTDDAGNVAFDAVSGLLTWTPGALDFNAPNNTATLNVTVAVLDPLPAGINSVTNSATVIHDDIEPTPADTTDSDTDTVNGAPDYTIVKDDGLTDASPGDSITYTITVRNVGNQDGTGVVVSDMFPTNVLTNVAADTGGVVDAVAGTITWNLGDLDAGDSVILTVTADVLDPIGAGIDDFTNTGGVNDDGLNGVDPTPDNNSDDDTNTLTAAPDYTIEKDDGLTSASPGDSITYTITVRNVGDQDGTGIVVSDAFPTNVLTNVTADMGGVVDAVAGTITWNLGNLDAGDSVVLTVSADVLDPISSGIDDFTNSISVTDDGANGLDPTPGNNSDTDTDTLDAAPDYTVLKDDGLTNVEAGDSITYIITVNNVGDQDGTGVVVSDLFPTNVLTNVVADSGGVVDAVAGSITWNLGDLDAGDTVILTVTADVLDPLPSGVSQFTNSVSVNDDGTNGTDPTPANNTAMDTDILGATPDYTIVKDDGLTDASPGDSITYIITVSNVGDQDGTGVVVSDVFPTNVLTNVVADSGGVVDEVAGTIIWNLGDLDAGDTVILTVTADVLDPAGAGIDDFTNSSSVTDDGLNGPDPTPDNNSDTDTDTLVAVPDYTIVKDDGLTNASPGDSIIYTITVQNVGNQDGTGVVVSDIFPADVLTNVVADMGGFVDAVAGTITWNLGDLAAGDTVILTVTADVLDPVGAGINDFTNSGSVADDGANGVDPTPGNNTDSDTDTLDAYPDYTIVKDDGVTNAAPGDAITYSLTVSNVGDQDGTGVVVSDLFPTNVLTNVVADNGGVVDAIAGTIAWNLGDLAGGETIVLTVTADVLDSVGAGIDDFTNSASVIDDGTNGDDPTPGNNMDEDTNILDAYPDLRVTKNDGLNAVTSGDSITYTIQVENQGNQTATGVTVNDLFPTDVLLNVTADMGGVVDVVAGTIDWTLGSIAAGDTVVLTVTADLPTTFDAGVELILNSASAQDDGTNGDDPTPEDNMDVDTDTVLATPDLTVAKSDGITTASTGDHLTYTVTVRNVGDQEATNVVVSDFFPASVLENVTADAGGVVDAVAGTITWNVASLPAGDVLVLTVEADVRNPLPAGVNDFTNSVSVTDDGTNGADPTPNNNLDEDIDAVDGSVTPDYTLQKFDGISAATAGDHVVYTIEVRNVGDQDGTGVVVSDVFPADILANVTADMGGMVDAVAGTITWNLGALGAGDLIVLTVEADVLAQLPAGADSFTNAAQVTDDGLNGVDPTPDNNRDEDTDLLNAQPDYVVTKDDGVSAASPGETITYTITVRNLGSQDGTGVEVVDSFPISVLTNVTADNGGVVNSVGGTITWNLGDLAAGDTVVLTVTADLYANLPARIDEFTNMVSVTDDATNGFDPTPENNQDEDTDALAAAPDYSVTKDDLETNVSPGDSITYTIVVQNTGNQDGTGVVVFDEFPTDALTNVVADTGGIVDGVAGTILWNLGDLDAGDSVTLTVTADVLDPVGAGLDQFTNTVSVTDDLTNGVDPTPGNNRADDTDLVDASPDYAITKDDGLSNVAPGDSIVYTLTVHNIGNQDGTGLTISDVFPASLLTNVTADQGAVIDMAAGTIQWSIPTLAVGDSIVLTVNAQVVDAVPAAVDRISNLARVMDDGTNGDDPTLDNNVAEDINTLEAYPDYVVVKDDGRTVAAAGDAIVYSIHVTNVGNQDGTGVVVNDVFPADVLTDVFADMGGLVDAAAGTITWNLGSLAAGDSVELTVQANVLSSVSGGIDSFTNSVSVTDDGTNGDDPTPNNNTDEDTDFLDAVPDLVISKDDGGFEAVPGDTVVYTLTYQNVGSQDATGVVISETLPAGTSFDASASSDGWVAVGGNAYEYTAGAVAAGELREIQFAVLIDDPASAGLQLTNTAAIADDGANGDDPTPENNTTTDVTPVAGSSASGFVFVDDGDGSFEPGEYPIEGVLITLEGTDVNGNVVLQTTYTDGNGYYEFTGLVPGDYVITQLHPADFTDGEESSQDGSVVGNDAINIRLEAGQNAQQNNFGESGIAANLVSKRYFLNSTPDGIYDDVLFHNFPSSSQASASNQPSGITVSAEEGSSAGRFANFLRGFIGR
jgi:fimbrial isopeptide formation D2 family protein/uncharacterized repeat protein (TIGR01451 family)